MYSMALAILFLTIHLASGLRATHAELPEVTLMRTPDGGIQPQAAVDHKGVLHLIYFKGDANAGDIYYVRKTPRAAQFSHPLRVNSVPGSAIAVGTVRGAQLAIGRGERVHVAWLGSTKALPRGPGGDTPMLYTRLNDAGTAFEPQRNVMQFATGLDGGGSVAADGEGNVYVVWHGNPAKTGEASRRVWVAHSSTEGKTFVRETAVSEEPGGACGCCALRALVDDQGALYILYRAATESIHRDMVLLVSRDRGKDFAGEPVAKWALNACPMTTDAISDAGRKILLAWETEGQVFFADVIPGTDEVSNAIPAPGPGSGRKHPAVAGNSRGEILLAWTEGTAWQRGGSLAWQVFDQAGHPMKAKGTAPGVPVWGLPTAYPRPDGGFTIVY
jgi:hypothetical protein